MIDRFVLRKCGFADVFDVFFARNVVKVTEDGQYRNCHG